MNLDQVEAIIWANSGALAHGTTPMRREAMGNILDAVTDYATTEVGLLTPAERRRILFENAS